MPLRQFLILLRLVFGSFWQVLALMSGALGIMFGFVSQSKVHLALIGCGISILVLAIKTARLEYRLLPRLKVRVGTKDDGCHKYQPHLDPPRLLLRLEISNDGEEEIKDCRGYITEVERNRDKIWQGNNIQLTFQPAEQPDSLSKTIRSRIKEYLDVIAIKPDGTIYAICTKDRHWPSFHPLLNDIFAKGDTIITIKVNGEGTVTTTTKFRLHIADEYQESFLEELI